MNDNTCTIGHCDDDATHNVTISRNGTPLEVRPVCNDSRCKTIARQTAADFDVTITART